MFEVPFYHAIIKKTIIAFGNLFSNVQVIRRKPDGTPYEIIKVPIAYGPKEKYFQRLNSDANMDIGIYATLPRLSFEILSYAYDSQAMTNKTQQIKCYSTDGTAQFIYNPVTYDLSITLSALTKGTEDGLAIVEQILPLFQPEYTVSIRAVPELNMIIDVPILLEQVQVNDDYEGDFNSRRLVTHTFEFTAKVKFPGNIRQGNKILHTMVNMPNPMNQKHESEGNPMTHEIILDEWSLNE